MVNRRSLIKAAPWIVLPVWLTATAGAFWWFEARDQRPFVPDLSPYAGLMQANAMPTGLRQALASVTRPSAKVTVVTFRDETCACNRFNASHLASIVAQSRDRGVRFLILDAAADGAGSGAGLARRLSPWLPIAASPSALVIGADGELAYFGPYSVGAGCLAGSGGFVERAIERALAGPTTARLNLLGTGCYCAWPTAARLQPSTQGNQDS